MATGLAIYSSISKGTTPFSLENRIQWLNMNSFVFIDLKKLLNLGLLWGLDLFFQRNQHLFAEKVDFLSSVFKKSFWREKQQINWYSMLKAIKQTNLW